MSDNYFGLSSYQRAMIAAREMDRISGDLDALECRYEKGLISEREFEERSEEMSEAWDRASEAHLAHMTDHDESGGW